MCKVNQRILAFCFPRNKRRIKVCDLITDKLFQPDDLGSINTLCVADPSRVSELPAVVNCDTWASQYR